MPANFPNNPVINQLYSYSGATWKFTGTKWQLVTVTDGNTGTLFTYSNTAPQAPSLGDRWLNSETLRQSIYINDGDTDQWVEPVSIGLAGAAKSLNNLANVSINTSLLPAANVTHDLGSSSLRWRDLYLSGNSIILGAATLTSTGSAVNLPAGTTVGGQNVATSGDVSTGGGPKITNLQITDNSWAVLDDTAVDTAGGYILITGTNFVSGALVYFNQTPATSVAFVSATTLQVTVPALTAGTYVVYVINPDGGTAIRVPGLTASANPAWQTASALPEQYDGVAITLNLVATEATSYTITSGSLPPGLSLNSNTGVITGTVTGVTVDTTYTFTVRATDAELQDSPRTFTVTITVSDPYFKLTTLLLSGSAMSSNTVVKDSSTNNFNLTVAGDARASNFTPYGTGWSYFFPAGGYVTTGTLGNSLGTGDFCMECWVYSNSYATNYAGHIIITCSAQTIFLQTSGNQLRFLDFNGGSNFVIAGGSVVNGRWYHIVGTRQSGTVRGFIDGQLVVTQASMNFNYGTVTNIQVSGTIQSYIAGARVTIGSVPAAYQTTSTTLSSNVFAVPTGYVSSEANTLLLTAQSNRFLNQIGNVSFATVSGSPRVTGFNPFNITNTGINGSMYFDGTGDYVQIANSANLAVGAGDFTIECWVNTSTFSVDTYYRRVFTFGPDAANNLQLLFFDGTNAVSTLNVYSNTILINGTITVANGAWHHVAVCRSGTSLKLFVDGVQSGSTATTSQNFDSAATNGLYIGRFSLAGGHFLGFISDFRVVKGTALYTTTFTPPTSPLTAVANTQLLTLQYDQPHNNHTFLDSSSNQFLITRSGNATQGTFSPFSPAGWSVYFIDTSSHNISAVTGAETSPGTGDFCAELWYWTSKSGNQALIGNLESNTETQWVLTLITGGVIRIQGWINTYVSGTSGPLNSWNHVAVCRSGTTMSIFVNGSRVGTATVTNNFSGTSNIRVGGPNGIDYFLGYISNARFVKGSSVYDPTQVSITVPTGPLTAITNTKFLVCQSNLLRDISSNNFTLTTSGSPQVQAFSPFAPTAVYSPVTHGGSGYFDGTGDDLSIATNTAFTDLPGDWTIECWFYSTSTSNQMLAGTSTFNTSGYFLELNYTAAGRVSFVPVPWSNRLESSSAVFTNYTWNHIAYVRSGTTVTIYVNGTSVVSGTRSVTSNSQPLTIGQAGNGWDGRYYFNGYISNFRVVKGTAIYTTNFTLPTTPLTATTNTQLLLNFTDAAILDSTGRNVLETVADAKTSSVVTKFTGGSMYFDGTGDSLITPASIVNSIGTGDFTIEFWCYPSNTAVAYRAIVASENYNSTAGGWSIYQNGTGIEIYLTGGALVTAASQLVASTWQHIALVRSGSASNNCKLYVNGTNVASATNTADWTGQKVFIGDNNYTGTDYFFNGYIQDLRITRGYARYTGNFTAPTAPARLK